MALSPFELIKRGAASLINQGKEVFRNPSSVPGILKNTITGLPQASRDVSNSVGNFIGGAAQGTARSVGTAGITAGNFPTQIYNKATGNNVPTPFGEKVDTSGTKSGRFLFGGEPVRDVRGYGQEGLNFIDSFRKPKIDGDQKITPKPLPKALAIPLGFAGLALDLSGGGKAAESLTKQGLEAIARSKEKDVVRFILKNEGKEVADDVLEKLVKSRDPKEIDNIIKGSKPKIIASPADEAAMKKTELEIRRDALENDPINNIKQRAFKKEGDVLELQDVRGAKSRLKAEDAMKSAGIDDTGKFKEAVDNFNARKAALEADEKALKMETKKSYKKSSEEAIQIFGNAKTDLMNTNKQAERMATYKDAQGVTRIDRVKQSEIEKQLLKENNSSFKKAANDLYDSLDPEYKIGDTVEYKYPRSPEEVKVYGEDTSPPRKLKIVNAEFDTMESLDQMNKTGFPSSFKLTNLVGIDESTGEVFNISRNGLVNGKPLASTIKKSSEDILKDLISKRKNPTKSLELSSVEAPRPASPLPDLPGLDKYRKPSGLSTGEARSLETIADQERYRHVPESSDIQMDSFDDIVRKMPTPVNKKVGIVDMIRTPENVFKKIGQHEVFKAVRKAHEGYVEELPKNIEKISAWAKQISPEQNKKIFRYLDGEAVDLTAKEVDIADQVKDYLAKWADRLGLPEDKRISNYITHIFDDQLVKKEFDEDLAKIISDKVPGSVYDPFLQSRLGAKGYKQDVFAALDAYTKRATRKVYMDPALNQLSHVAESLEKSQYDYIKKFADRVNMRPSDFDTAVDNSIKNVIGYKLGQRPVAKLSRLLRQMSFRGMIGANVGSTLRNLSQGVNTYAKLGEKYTAIGYAKMASLGTKELNEVGILADNFITDRTISATGKALEKLDKGLFYLFDTAEKVNRGAAYYGAKSKALAEGKTLDEAIEYAKKTVRDTQFQYSAIDTPLALQDDITKIFLQFLSYPIKQAEFLAGMAKNKEYMGIARYIIGGLAFVYTAGKAVGMEPKELIPFSGYATGEQRFGTPPSLKLPVEVAKAALNTPDKYGNVRTGAQKMKDIKDAAWGVLPGGIQLKKTLEGRKAVQEGGVFTASGNKEFDVGGTPAKNTQAYLFGKYSSKEAKTYFDKKQGTAPKSEADKLIEAADAKKDEEKKRVRKVWLEATSLKNTGKTAEAEALVDKLSDADYELYKEIRSTEKAKSTKSGIEQMYDTVIEAQKLKESGDLEGAKALVDGLTDEEYKLYVSAKKKLGY